MYGAMRGVQANGEQIQATRLERGLTVEQLASLAGVDVKTVRKAERGQRVDLSTLTRISFSLDVDVRSLLVMTRSRLELELHRRDAVRRWHRGWEAHDIEELLSVYHEDAVLHMPGAPDIPCAGEHHGRKAIREMQEIAWNTCVTEPMSGGDFRLVTSDNTVILSGRVGIHLPDGLTVQLWCVQIFTFHDGSELVVDHRVEYDTLRFARLMRLPQRAEPTKKAPGESQRLTRLINRQERRGRQEELR
jgi:transcriptional regulator with XRE-family HTH domain